ncbi:hypothetical protein ACTJI8_09635 [Microbacterium sp. 22303]|uniref:hypothetical protein n=1 Tax=Microbacterium sp. 22303 TaxID=3453905 RepID=UPI003F844309
MSNTESAAAAPVTVSHLTHDAYTQEMNVRLAEWRGATLEPALHGSDFLPFILLTVALPVLALFGAWFL